MALSSVLVRGFRLGVQGGRRAVPKLRSGVSSLAKSQPARTVAKGVAVGGATAAVGTGLGFGVDAVRKGFYNPRSQSFPDTLATGISPEEAGDDREVREQGTPTAVEFFTGNQFLLFALIAVVLVVLLTQRRR